MRTLLEEKRLIPDERGRVTLPKKEGVSSYHAVFKRDGVIVLTPMAEIPARELWLWRNEEALASVKEGLAQSAKGEVVALDLSTLPADDE